MTTTPTPSPEAVSVLTDCLNGDVVMAKLLSVSLSQSGFTIIRLPKWNADELDAWCRCVAEGDEEKAGQIKTIAEYHAINAVITRAEPAPLADDISIDNLIKQLDMGEPDPSDYEVAKHLFDAQDRHRAAMSNIKVRLLCIKSLRAHIAALTSERDLWQTENNLAQRGIALHLERIAALEADNKRLRDLLECWDGVSTSHEPTGHHKYCGCLRCETQAALTQPEVIK